MRKEHFASQETANCFEENRNTCLVLSPNKQFQLFSVGETSGS